MLEIPLAMTVKIVFFAGIFVLWYSYFGYGLIIWCLLKIKRQLKKRRFPITESPFYPPITLIIAAYNEEGFIIEKIKNTLSLDYPKEQLKLIFITDGSSDATPSLVSQFTEIRLLHEPARNGKMAAMHRAMSFVETPYVIFSDANTYLNKECIKNIVRHYQDKSVGGVAGEKKILQFKNDTIVGSGEGLYWKYEALLKQLDSDFYTVVGAAGELFSVRTDLYEYPGRNALLDDFVVSLKVCLKGYRVAYESNAYALETPSVSIKEEQKRKTRISAGAFQSMFMLKGLFNIFKHPRLSFQYISHRVLRWTLCPLFLPLVLITNILIAKSSGAIVYDMILGAQFLFYIFAFCGWILSLRDIKIPIFYVAYYFLFINLNLYLGFFKYLQGKQSVLWDKAERKAVMISK